MRDEAYIKRLIKYCSKISEYMKPVSSFNDFASNLEKIDAVILNLEQIGETAKKLTVEIKEKYLEVNWQSIIGLRNMISHEYEGIRLEIIYMIATKHIPVLMNNLNN
ncbi:DUF86 domain-containing protein [Candidatus Izemoplasma sp. B36]|uniref:HepT-like ribonuclease domain-containing protein n=1 Tax=Candidatus Izemoplasma sp. B36 TaxID=3242468 RepID=UPI003558B271